MNNRRRLALVIVALPLAFYGYACSSDSTDTPAGEDGGTGAETGTNPGIDSGTGTDSSTGTDTGTGTDASDGAVAPTCIGNPLTADGGTLDGGVDLDGAVATQIVTAFAGDFLDGPQWLDADGGILVYSEYNTAAPQLLRVAADGGANASFRTAGFTTANGPVGNAVRNGVVITAVDAQNGSGTPTFLLTASDGGAAGSIALGDAGATSPNDLVVGPANNLYFTDGQYQNVGNVGTAGLYRIAGDGGVFSLAQGFGRANGIALSPDSTKLYVGVGPKFNDPDPRQVLTYDVSATGVVTTPGATFLGAADLVDVPDGIAVDVAGNLWIAEAKAEISANNGPPGGRVEVFSPTKKKLGTIPFTTQRPTGVAFGGADGKTLFITTETGVFTYVSRCAGVR